MKTTRGNSPNIDGHVEKFIRSPLFNPDRAEDSVQNYVSKTWGRWLERRGLDPQDACDYLRKNVIATGRYTYDAMADKFIEVKP